MQVQVGSFWSSPRALLGGVPQGSILDVLPVLFKVTTDDLEQDFEKTQASFGTDPGAVVQGPPPSYSSLPLQMVVRSPSTSPPVGDFSSIPVRDGRPIFQIFTRFCWVEVYLLRKRLHFPPYNAQHTSGYGPGVTLSLHS